MEELDLRLLVSLQALLEEGSVAGAAERLDVSPPAMSRSLARLRAAIGDPLFVRAGRGLVPTTAALSLRDELGDVMERARRILRPAGSAGPETLRGTYTLRCSDSFAGTFAAAIIARTHARSKNIALRFVAEGTEDVESLRDGRVHVDLGVIGAMGPEIRLQMLYRDQFVGVVRPKHPLASRVDIGRFVEAEHVVPSRRGMVWTPVDDALRKHEKARRVIATVPSFYSALEMVAQSDLVACVPERTCRSAIVSFGLHTFPLPVQTERVTVSAAWHPRFDVDPAVRLIRKAVEDACSGSQLVSKN